MNNLVMNAYALDRAIEVAQMIGVITPQQAQGFRATIVAGTGATGLVAYKIVRRLYTAIPNLPQLLEKGQSHSNLPSSTEVEVTPGNQIVTSRNPGNISGKKRLRRGLFDREPSAMELERADEETRTATITADGDTVMSAARSSGAGAASAGGRGGMHGETPISPYDFVQIGLPKTVTTKLPYYRYVGTNTVATGTGSSAVNGYAFRLNSIYDVQAGSTFYDIGWDAGQVNPAADATVGTVNLPKWRPYFADKYQYWTVIGCDYKLRMRCTTLHQNASLMCYMFKCGLQKPPLVDTAGTPAVITHEWKRTHTGVEYKELRAQPTRASGQTGAGTFGTTQDVQWNDNWITFSGRVKPGMVDHEIQEDEFSQTWHRINEVPPTPELLVFHVQRAPWSPDVELNFEFEMELTYLVQFKDLKAIFQYPHKTTSFAAVSSIDQV